MNTNFKIAVIFGVALLAVGLYAATGGGVEAQTNPLADLQQPADACCALPTQVNQLDPLAADTIPPAEKPAEVKWQTTCPIMGNEINKKLFHDYKGKRIYVCCPPCVKMVANNPEAALKKIAENGETPYPAPAPEKKSGADGAAAEGK